MQNQLTKKQGLYFWTKSPTETAVSFNTNFLTHCCICIYSAIFIIYYVNIHDILQYYLNKIFWDKLFDARK